MAINRTCQWILSLLPEWEKRQCYCEPFAGMLGVLLNRKQCYLEIANDKSDRIWSIWKAIRDDYDEFYRKLDLTLYHESAFKDALNSIDKLDGVDKAVASATIVIMSVQNTPHGRQFRRYFSRQTNIKSEKWFYDIHNRIKNVVFLCKDYQWVFDRIKDFTNYVVYVDPPYQNADVSPYGNNTVDHNELMELLKVQKGKVAISGYGNTYDELGWEKHTKLVKTCNLKGNQNLNKTYDHREEVLWTNYAPNKILTLFDE